MKRILFLILILVPLVGQSQVTKQRLTVVDSTAFVSDTVDLALMDNTYGWTIEVQSWSLDKTDGTVTIYVSDSVSGPWIKYNDNAVLSIPATGVVAFEDDHLWWKYMRLSIDSGTVASGDYRIKMQRIRRQ